MDQNTGFRLIENEEDSLSSSRYSNLLLSAKNSIDCYFANLTNHGSWFSETIFELLMKGRKAKGLNVRIIASINQENIELSKQLIKYSNLYQMDKMLGNFCIVDNNTYLCDIEEEQGIVEHGRQIYCNHIPFVKVQQGLFENLLRNAMPAIERIKQIEGGAHREYVETLRDPSQILQLVRDRIENAAFEIQVFFATINSFYRAEQDRIIDLFGNVSNRGVKVQILVKIDDEGMKDTSKQKIKQKHEYIDVTFIRQSLKSNITTIIIDQAFSITMEINDDSKTKYSEAAGLATFSNSESTVYSNYLMFENLWMEAELERLSRTRQAYFKMFDGQRLKDELYKREWKLRNNNNNNKE